MSENRSILVRISGRVQGVGYRDWTRYKATEFGLSGWVRNLASGEVEAMFSGPAAKVEAMLDACRHGPRSAHVDEVIMIGPAEPMTGLFAIRR